MKVMDGLTQEVDAICAPSVTKTLAASCNWLNLLTTEVRGSAPMQAPPISWMASPVGFLNNNSPEGERSLAAGLPRVRTALRVRRP